MARGGVRSARASRGQTPTLERESRVPDGVDTAVYPEEPAGRDAPPDRFAVQARGEELLERDHALLARGEWRDQGVGIGGCAEYVTPSVTGEGHPVKCPWPRHTDLRAGAKEATRKRNKTRAIVGSIGFASIPSRW